MRGREKKKVEGEKEEIGPHENVLLKGIVIIFISMLLQTFITVFK